jgi:undecaprenyl-diphosphatase
MCLALTTLGAEQGAPEHGGVRAAEKLDYKAAAVLGIVEGVTEYLPVSSTGHLIFANVALGLNQDVGALDKTGQALWTSEREPLPVRIIKKARGGPVVSRKVQFTLKNAADAYIIVIQFGAILAVVFAYWKRVCGLVRGVLSWKKNSLLLARNLIAAFLPAAVIGVVFNRLIEEFLFGTTPVLIALVAGGVVMLVIDRWHRKRMAAAAGVEGDGGNAGPDLHELPVARALGIGVAQCAALWPGTSRSMATICGGYLAGLSPVRATEFSFLLGLITLTAAAGYKLLGTGKLILAAFEAGPMVAGLAVAAVTAFISVKWLVDWIGRHGLALFAWYRIALGVALLVFALAR